MIAIILDNILRGFEHLSKHVGFKPFIVMLIIGILIATVPTLFKLEEKADFVIGGKIGAEPAILINIYKFLQEDETTLNVGVRY